MSRFNNFIKFLYLFLIGLVISSCQIKNEKIGLNHDKEFEDITNLLIHSLDFNQDEYMLETEFYSFERRFNIPTPTRASLNISGKHLETGIYFLLIHEISFYKNGDTYTSTAEKIIDPSWHQISIQVLGENYEAYCISSEIDYLSWCIVIIKNEFLVSTIEVRVFENSEPTAIKIVSLGINLFIERLNNSEFK